MLVTLILLMISLWLGYCLGYDRGKKYGWTLAKRLPCIHHLSSVDG